MQELEQKSSETSCTVGNTIAKGSQHSILERDIRFFVFQFFFQNFVHSFCFLMGLAALGAFDQMGVERVSFVVVKLAGQIGRELSVDIVVNGHGCSEPRAALSCLRLVDMARPSMP